MSQPTASRPSSLLLFTTSQTPLAPRYPHPAKPTLLLPPLVHTTLHNALDSDTPSWSILRSGASGSTSTGTTVIIPNPKSLGPSGANGTLSAGLSQKSSLASLKSSASNGGRSTSPAPSSPTFQDEEKERLDNEVTVKFYIIGSQSKSGEGETSTVSEQKVWIQEGLEVLEKYKRPTWGFGSGQPSLPSSTDSDDASSDRTNSPTGSTFPIAGKIDTFLLGWKGIDYIGKKTESTAGPVIGAQDDDSQEDSESEKLTPKKRQPGCGSAKLASREAAERDREESGGIVVSEEKKREMVELWKSLGDLVPNAVQVGTLSLPLPLLKLLHSESNGVSPLGSSTNISAQAKNGNHVPSAAKAQPSDDENTISSMSSSDPVPNEDDSIPTSATSASFTDRSLLSTLLDQTNGGLTTVPTLVGSESDQLEALKKRHEKRSQLGQVRKPRVNSLNTPDCHSLPEGLMKWAKEEGVELWAGGSGIGSDPMPSIHLHNTLAEFVPQFPAELISGGSNLGKVVPFPENGSASLTLGVDVRWVMSYTVISRTRNVVKDKGYIISAALL